MNKLAKSTGIFAFCTILSGCFTISETPLAQVETPRAAKTTTIKVEGFDATVTDFIPVTTTTTEFGGAWGGGRRGRRGGGGIRTYNSVTYLPERHETAIYRERAKAALEKAGFICRAANPEYTVRCDFGGIVEAPGLWGRRAAYCASLFLYDSQSVSMTANLRIYENSTGRLLHEETLAQDYAASGWSLIPFFGMQDHEPTAPAYIRHWCRATLADRATAAAAAVLATSH